MIYVQTIQMSDRIPIDQSQFVLSYVPGIGWELFHQAIAYGSSYNPQTWLKIWDDDHLICDSQPKEEVKDE